MESVPRASVDINTPEPAPAAAAKKFTLTLNKNVVYGLGVVAVVALGALGVASVAQHDDDTDCGGDQCCECWSAAFPPMPEGDDVDVAPPEEMPDCGEPCCGGDKCCECWSAPKCMPPMTVIMDEGEDAAWEPPCQSECDAVCNIPAEDDEPPPPDEPNCPPGDNCCECWDDPTCAPDDDFDFAPCDECSNNVDWSDEDVCNDGCPCDDVCAPPKSPCEDTCNPICDAQYGDGTDAAADVEECAPNCPKSWIGDGICDEHCMVPECGGGEDGGDCDDNGAPGTEDDGEGESDGELPPMPGQPGGPPAGYAPAPAPWDDGTAGTDGTGGKDCAEGCFDGWEGDNYCDEACNVAACNFDKGDCDGAGGTDGTDAPGPAPWDDSTGGRR